MRALLAAGLLLICAAAQAAERVVSLAPSMSEIMLELGAESRLVGMLDGGERPAGLADLPTVGRFGSLDVESLLSLKPDLILLTPGSLSDAQRQQLTDLGLALYLNEARDFDQLAEAFAEIGARVGQPERGADLRAQFRDGMQALRQRYRRSPAVPVFYQIWHQPLYTIGTRQLIGEALQVCGARNVFADLTLPAPQVSVEAVLARAPEVILGGSGAELQHWQAWPQLPAVRLRQVWTVPDKGLERPSFQMLAATARLCEQLAQAR
ncbi:cobalamin-binding protein [Pseudomonas sp. GOM6]|uniref:cobalamin-binding protein n=1 Tax=Pseudomonas sp. GOM6 TaxID=3036944 RepID=UPI0024099798|nr:cobalamin-binding protein [Pseudomonas sp. GOM6]MDG1582181.1 cobalamin-binding protein [Pseudomonas sp. GOM6]